VLVDLIGQPQYTSLHVLHGVIGLILVCGELRQKHIMILSALEDVRSVLVYVLAMGARAVFTADLGLHRLTWAATADRLTWAATAV